MMVVMTVMAAALHLFLTLSRRGPACQTALPSGPSGRWRKTRRVQLDIWPGQLGPGLTWRAAHWLLQIAERGRTDDQTFTQEPFGCDSWEDTPTSPRSGFA